MIVIVVSAPLSLGGAMERLSEEVRGGLNELMDGGLELSL